MANPKIGTIFHPGKTGDDMHTVTFTDASRLDLRGSKREAFLYLEK